MNTGRGVLLGFLAFLLGLAGIVFVAIPLWKQNRQLENRILVAQNTMGELQVRVAALSVDRPAVHFREDLLWRSHNRPDAELALQDRLIDVARRFNFALRSFQTTAPTQRERYQKIGVTLEGTGSLSSFFSFLNAVETDERKIAFSDLIVRLASNGQSDDSEITVAFRLNAWGFWEELQ